MRHHGVLKSVIGNRLMQETLAQGLSWVGSGAKVTLPTWPYN